VAILEPIQRKYADIRASGEIRMILRDGAERATVVAAQTLREVKEAMGFLPRLD
jgi:tryptophanyl-tRNA synthetase